MSITAAAALIMLASSCGERSDANNAASVPQASDPTDQRRAIGQAGRAALPEAWRRPGAEAVRQEQAVPAAPTIDAEVSSQANRAASAETSAPQTGDIVVTARPPGDPIRAVNVRSFAATQAVDEAITGPAALAYKRVVPDPVRSGFRNFANNLHEPNVALNYLLQLKPGKAAETVGRFAINSTIGIAGILDLAKRRPFKLPRRPNGFANTLGYYGVGPGAFVFLPLIGPTTVRDIAGGGVDRLLGLSFLPLGGRAYVVSTGTLRVLDRRAERDGQFQAIRESADPYESRRALYMRTRQAEIDQLHGRKTVSSDSIRPFEDAAQPMSSAPQDPAAEAPSDASPASAPAATPRL
jgi:phospholipid-binding lipoprotein MlaA